MRFSTRKDADMTAEALFEAVSDFDRLERIIRRRGAKVERLDPMVEGIMAWDIAFDWRGRPRQTRLAVTRHDPCEIVRMAGTSDSFDITIDMMIVALTRKRSRLIIDILAAPRTMKARLLVQTAKLGKAQLDRRFDQGVAVLVEKMTENRA